MENAEVKKFYMYLKRRLGNLRPYEHFSEWIDNMYDEYISNLEQEKSSLTGAELIEKSGSVNLIKGRRFKKDLEK